MSQLVGSRWFALTDLFLAIISAVAWMLFPESGVWFSLIALLPWVLRLLDGQRLFQRTPFDWLIAVFLVTAWIGYWTAYDKSAAGLKFWLLVSAVLLFYALSAQPKQNLVFLSFLSFCFALALSLYFCLTYDFSGIGFGIGTWWTNHRPYVDWPAIHYDDVLGPILISAILAFHWLWSTGKKSSGSVTFVMQLFLILGIAIVALVFALTLSRAIGLIALFAAGIWLLWRVSILSGSNVRVRAIFPGLVLIFLALLITVAYLGPASDDPTSTGSNFGTNTRAELFERGSFFLFDYALTGAGLSSFPGIYSQYMLVIPHSYFSNSYNLFLDVAIEQGITAGCILIILYTTSVFLVSQSIAKDPLNELQFMRWLGLLALIVTVVHGLFYDYLYHGNGAALLFFPIGMVMGIINGNSSEDEAGSSPKTLPLANMAMITLPALALIFMFGVSINKVMALWNANLGAVRMARVELKDFPTGQWATSEMLPGLEAAESTLYTALQYDSNNQTANYRLGLIAMLRQDFGTAAANLKTAYLTAPNHRGIIKSLGYCYVWLGDMEKAQALLGQIPEAQHELKNYIWWWETQGRPDLSENAARMVSLLDPAPQ